MSESTNHDIFKTLNDDLTSGDKYRIIQAIIYSTEKGDDYNYALSVCKKFYYDRDQDVRRVSWLGLSGIIRNFQKLDLQLAITVIRYAFKQKDGSITSVFEDICNFLPKAKRIWFKNELEEFYAHFYSPSDNHLFITDEVIEENLKAVNRSIKDLEFCCNAMHRAVINQCVEYEIIFKRYGINFFDNFLDVIKFCPWCGIELGPGLSCYFDSVLEEEYKILTPDLIKFTNIPAEFQTDEWWKKRGL